MGQTMKLLTINTYAQQDIHKKSKTTSFANKLLYQEYPLSIRKRKIVEVPLTSK